MKLKNTTALWPLATASMRRDGAHLSLSVLHAVVLIVDPDALYEGEEDRQILFEQAFVEWRKEIGELLIVVANARNRVDDGRLAV